MLWTKPNTNEKVIDILNTSEVVILCIVELMLQFLQLHFREGLCMFSQVITWVLSSNRCSSQACPPFLGCPVLPETGMPVFGKREVPADMCILHTEQSWRALSEMERSRLQVCVNRPGRTRRTCSLKARFYWCKPKAVQSTPEKKTMHHTE